MPYVYYNPNPCHKNTGDCVVRAVSRLLGLTWEEAYVELSIQGYLDKALIVDDNVWGNYLARNGYAMHQLPNTCPRCYSVLRFAEDHPYGKYLVKTPGHVIAVVDGDYYDTSDTGGEVPIYYWRKEQ
jgi:hypothetical protein